MRRGYPRQTLDVYLTPQQEIAISLFLAGYAILDVCEILHSGKIILANGRAMTKASA